MKDTRLQTLYAYTYETMPLYGTNGLLNAMLTLEEAFPIRVMWSTRGRTMI